MTTRLLLSLLLLVAIGAGSRRSEAFSLGGALPTWYTDNTGRSNGGDVLGPVNLGEEYRWAVPQIVYAFDESFINYFGQRGIEHC